MYSILFLKSVSSARFQLLHLVIASSYPHKNRNNLAAIHFQSLTESGPGVYVPTICQAFPCVSLYFRKIFPLGFIIREFGGKNKINKPALRITSACSRPLWIFALSIITSAFSQHGPSFPNNSLMKQ